MPRFIAWLAGLWSSLFDITQPPARYIGRALVLDLPVTLLLATLVGLTIPKHGPDFSHIPNALVLPMLCVIGPLIETVMMMLFFCVLRFATRRMAYLVILSTLIWMGLHSLGAPAHGLGIFWMFLILSICYLCWETRSRSHAFWMTAALHALHNLPFALLFLASKFQ